MNVKQELAKRIEAALQAAGAPEGSEALIAQAARPDFGHYQANGVMGAAKKLKMNPRELAQKVVDSAEISDIAEPLEIAGPGFINIRLKPQWLGAQLDATISDENLGTCGDVTPKRVVVDYCGPNLAKEMHVGHLRSTIIGDAIARVLEFLGNDVIRQNHVGDWGTQFGMLIAYMDRLAAAGEGELTAELKDLERFYQAAKKLFDTDEEFAQTARENVVKLQGGDEHCLASWKAYIDESLNHCDTVCERLGVNLSREDVRAESSYNDDLAAVVADLDSAGMLTESQGAQCVFLDGFTNKDGEPLPVIVQKSDGGYLYSTTDLAGLRYRSGELKADRILYVVDARQALHFKQILQTARQAGFLADNVAAEHVGFGTMMGDNGKPFKTRDGGTVKLMALLDEAHLRAFTLVNEKLPDVDQAQRLEIARVVGIGAVKYADLCQNRSSDYVFSWEKMLSFEGNTAPYMQYAYARVKSLFRKGDVSEADATGPITIAEPAEMTLAVKLSQFAEIIEMVADDGLPNILCGYLFDLAGAFMSFYEACPVLKAENPAIVTSRLTLSLLTSRILKKGLDLLGIETLEQM